jgi:hypothetical protein
MAIKRVENLQPGDVLAGSGRMVETPASVAENRVSFEVSSNGKNEGVMTFPFGHQVVIIIEEN